MMNAEETAKLLSQCRVLFEAEGRLIELRSSRAVFVGDTHGDLDATQKVIGQYLNDADTTLVFLGDYVDRGPHSAENLNTLLKLKLEHPSKIFLLMGNHEGVKAIQLHPADFWESLPPKMHQNYAETLSHLPFAVTSANGIIALHGALPDITTLADFDRIEPGSREWRQITWGDWEETGGDSFIQSASGRRPRFDRQYFDEMMNRFGKRVLIRSHQPDISQVAFDGRCLTIFTSDAYSFLIPQRTIAIADMQKQIKTVDDLQIELI